VLVLLRWLQLPPCLQLLVLHELQLPWRQELLHVLQLPSCFWLRLYFLGSCRLPWRQELLHRC
jgi:hypothetical protein